VSGLPYKDNEGGRTLSLVGARSGGVTKLLSGRLVAFRLNSSGSAVVETSGTLGDLVGGRFLGFRSDLLLGLVAESFTSAKEVSNRKLIETKAMRTRSQTC
jgi:hypothetical protein